MPRGRPRLPDHLRPIVLTIRLRPDVVARIDALAAEKALPRAVWISSTLSHAATPLNPHPSDPRAAA